MIPQLIALNSNVGIRKKCKKVKMPNICVICEEKPKLGDARHEFPLNGDREIVENWIKASGKPKNWRPTKSNRICGKHFLPEDYTFNSHGKARQILEKGSVPSVNIKPSCKLFHVL
jgi:THAP domain